MNYFEELKTKIGLLPTDLKWLFWFSVYLFSFCTLLLLFVREQLYEQIVPYTGWSPGTIYFFFIIMLIGMPKTSLEMNKDKHMSLLNVRRSIVFLLGFYLIIGIYDWFDSTPEFYNHSNPYLRYDPLRPFFAILLPLLWILIVVSPLMKDFFRKRLKTSIKKI
ncbi:hypothetical protein [Flavobacterium sp.]|uniref:hypothetical protein n=1 Tax=Flavobacterium sp. TaxID=239 RepID=UPI002D7E8D4C|nr:hypothetical protein [Flavobacterium sp.]